MIIFLLNGIINVCMIIVCENFLISQNLTVSKTKSTCNYVKHTDRRLIYCAAYDINQRDAFVADTIINELFRPS